MPKYLPKRCKRCQARKEDGARISRRGLCMACAQQGGASAAVAMKTKTGPEWDRWLASMRAAFADPPPPGEGAPPVSPGEGSSNISAAS